MTLGARHETGGMALGPVLRVLAVAVTPVLARVQRARTSVSPRRRKLGKRVVGVAAPSGSVLRCGGGMAQIVAVVAHFGSKVRA
jgi:hypothetical protein